MCIRDRSICLYEDQWNRLQVPKMRFTYFNISVRKRETPLRIYIKHEAEMHSNTRLLVSDGTEKLLIYGSPSVEKPSKFNNDGMWESKNIKIDESTKDKIFSHNHYYFAVFSESDADLNIRFKFGHVRRDLSHDTKNIHHLRKQSEGLISHNSIEGLSILQLREKISKKPFQNLSIFCRGDQGKKSNGKT
eukprot:TRINITY_DN13075_c0_g1_i1.p1 TRINITY_DN13075_c0_g1~~TRINITY_DN13075_c0_g1_i1.p1  ORF type:complete len:190 (+),score=6.11 TRINITY_DN13075_c0_g1_i1:66-635(+)